MPCGLVGPESRKARNKGRIGVGVSGRSGQGKGRDVKDDFVILIDEALKPLREYLSTRGNLVDTDPLFASISDRNNGEGLTTKSIRRIVKSILRGVNLNDVHATYSWGQNGG